MHNLVISLYKINIQILIYNSHINNFIILFLNIFHICNFHFIMYVFLDTNLL